MESDTCTKHGHVKGVGPFFGRLLVSIIFILGGLGKIVDFQGSVELLRAMGIWGAETLIFIALILELVGGILLALGWFTRLGTILLMIFLLPVTLIVHGFWNYEGAQMIVQFSSFIKNVAIYGALITLFSYGPGRWSLDAARCARH